MFVLRWEPCTSQIEVPFESPLLVGSTGACLVIVPRGLILILLALTQKIQVSMNDSTIVFTHRSPHRLEEIDRCPKQTRSYLVSYGSASSSKKTLEEVNWLTPVTQPCIKSPDIDGRWVTLRNPLCFSLPVLLRGFVWGHSKLQHSPKNTMFCLVSAHKFVFGRNHAKPQLDDYVHQHVIHVIVFGCA